MSYNSFKENGYVYIVGAGPGDPGLFSIKGKLALEQADIVLVDHLVHPSLLSYCSQKATIIYVGKQRGKHSITQKGINDYLKKYADQKKIIVRLKGGDPFVFGRVGEEMQWLVRHNISFEIIPGISSAIAGPGYFGIPVTHRDYSRSVGFVTGTLKKGEVPLEIPATDTIVFLMGYYGLEYLVDMLLKEDRFNSDTPIALISRATCADQSIITATLSTIVARSQEDVLPTPVLVVVGRVVELNQVCNWVSYLPLATKKVVLCRQKGQHEQWYNELLLAGAEVVYLPVIKTLLDKKVSEKLTLSLLNSVTKLVFTSANAVTYFVECLKLNKIDIRQCAHISFYSLGPNVTDTLQTFGLKPDVEAVDHSVDGLLASLDNDLSSEHILHLTSDIAATQFNQECLERGARFTRLNIYNTTVNPIDCSRVNSTDYILVTSPSVIDALLSLNATLDKTTPLVVLGSTTKMHCESLGFTSVYKAAEPNICAVIETLVSL